MDIIEKGQTTRRGEFLVTEIRDTTRVTHPKTADVIHLSADHFVVLPVAPQNPVAQKTTFAQCMEHCAAYIGRAE